MIAKVIKKIEDIPSKIENFSKVGNIPSIFSMPPINIQATLEYKVVQSAWHKEAF